MFWLVQPDLAATRQAHLGNRTPALFVHRSARHIFLRQRRYFSRQVVTQEIQLVVAVLVGGVKRRFGRGYGKNKPAAAGIHACKTKYLAKKKCAIRFRILAVNNDVSARNHSALRVEQRK